MGCTGDREKGPPEQTQKWDYITLSDFKSTSSWNTLAYLWVWIMAIVAVIVYAADTYTAINLLAFNHWTSKIEPALDIKYSRWIFAGCILLSWALAILEWIRAIRVIKRGGVAESYMDPLAVTLQSMRGQGWRRFLVFSALTKSRKGADYVALFVYFAFKGAIRIIVAEGPRQVINGMTLYAVAQKDLFSGATDNHSWIEQFWINLQNLFDTNKVQAATMVTMLFTAIIWIISALSLLTALILYLVFLWHYIPQQDGRLSIYCRRKIDKRLEKIVETKVKAAIEEEERQKRKAEQRADLKRQKTGELLPPIAPKLARQPTLPQLGATPETKSEDKLPEFTLARQDTTTSVSTLPLYSNEPPNNSNPGIVRQPTLPNVTNRPAPSRTETEASAWSNTSYESNAPLLANAGYAGDAGYNQPSRPPTAFSRQDSNSSYNNRPMPGRTMTQNSTGTQRSYNTMSRTNTPGPQRAFTPMSQMDGSRQPVGPRMPVRTNTAFSYEQEPRSAVTPISPGESAYNRPMRQNTNDSFGPGPLRQGSPASFKQAAQPPPPVTRQQTFGSLHSHSSSFSRPIPPTQQRNNSQASFNRPYGDPANDDRPQLSHADSYEMMPQAPYVSRTPAPIERQPSNGAFVAFNPSLHSTSSTPVPQPGPQRSVTVAGGPGTNGNYFGNVQPQVPQRSATARIADNRATIGYSDIVDDYGSLESIDHRPQLPQQSATANPQDPHAWRNDRF